eukprot:UN18203
MLLFIIIHYQLSIINKNLIIILCNNNHKTATICNPHRNLPVQNNSNVNNHIPHAIHQQQP